MFKAAIFDLDGLLIDSEPLWRQAESATFRKYGVDLNETMVGETMGLRTHDVVKYWQARFPQADLPNDVVATDIDNAFIELVIRGAIPKEGAFNTINICQTNGLQLAIASSSSMRIIDAAIKGLGLEARFDIACSAENEEHGKPHPAVYHSAIRALGVAPDDCICFEDSLTGLRSAKAAGLCCVAVPDPEQRDQPGFAVANLTLNTLADFSVSTLRQLGQTSR
jgi:sugar-phosphatase